MIGTDSGRVSAKAILERFYLPVFCALLLIFLAQLIPEPTKLFSSDVSLRKQTNALLRRSLALADDPGYLAGDYAWDHGKVQQVWGLGVPAWRLIFECIWRILGKEVFPDRIAFIAAFLLVANLIGRFNSLIAGSFCEKVATRWIWLPMFLVVLFPPFIALCSSRFIVYEEVEAYAFLVNILLLFWTLWLSQRPSTLSFTGIAFASGLVVLVRPTCAAYGISSLLIASAVYWNKQRKPWILALSIALFSIAGVMALTLNMIRFGNPGEFGHSLNTNGEVSMAYAARFGTPYSNEPLYSAAKELFGLLFLARSKIDASPYGTQLFPGQSLTFRWRELYFSTFDLTIFLMALIVLVFVAKRIYFRLKTHDIQTSPIERVLMLGAFWSFISSVPLFFFYLRFPFISSRYVMDFAPCFAGIIWVFFWGLMNSLPQGKLVVTWIAPLLLVGWWVFEIATIYEHHITSEENRTLSLTQVNVLMRNSQTRYSFNQIPNFYTNGFPFETVGIPLNGTGWNIAGETENCVSLYVENPDCLKLEVASARRDHLSPDAYLQIKAKIGLEFLKLQNMRLADDKATIVFRGPQIRRYQTGIQLLSLGMVDRGGLSIQYSAFRLLKVTWHDENRGMNTEVQLKNSNRQ